MSAHSYGHLLIDGPNIDMVFGRNILGRKPLPHERPRWDRPLKYCNSRISRTAAQFVLNGECLDSGENRVFAFRRVVRNLGYTVPSPRSCEIDPVDLYMVQYIRNVARQGKPCTMAILSHDHRFAPELRAIQMMGGTVWVIGFPEQMSADLRQLTEFGAEILDLERDVKAFDFQLPRPRIAS